MMKAFVHDSYFSIWNFLRNYKWRIYGIFLVVFVASFLTVIDSYLLKILVDKISSSEDRFDFFADKKYLIIVVLFIVLNVAFNFVWRVINYLRLKTFPEVRFKLSSEIFEYLIAHNHRYFQENMAGDLANKVQNISEGIEDIFIPILSTIYVFFTICIAVVAVYTINFYFSLILAIWVIFFIGISLILSKKIMSYSKDFAEMRSILSGKFVDSLLNVFSVNIFSRQNFERGYLEKTSYEVMRKDLDLRWQQLILWATQGVFCSLVLGIIVFVLIFLRSKAIVNTGDFVFIVSITITIIQQVFGVAELISRITEQIGICRQAFSVIYTPHNVVDCKDAKNLLVDKGKIIFKNVKFGYIKDKILFNNLNLKISSKQKIGLVGYSGSGKTTFVNLLLRLFDIEQGEILIDQQSIRNVRQGSLRDNISFIPQNPTLFHRSFKENIGYGKIDATDGEVMEAAKKAHIHEDILTTANGYDSLLGENGIKISAGQRQRVAIARAILKNAPILILDEATSSLDSITEELIQESLESLMRNKTVITIAHRLSTLLVMDRILVFDKGKIIEDGTHKELLNKKGLYYRLWSSQVSGFLRD